MEISSVWSVKMSNFDCSATHHALSKLRREWALLTCIHIGKESKTFIERKICKSRCPTELYAYTYWTRDSMSESFRRRLRVTYTTKIRRNSSGVDTWRKRTAVEEMESEEESLSCLIGLRIH